MLEHYRARAGGRPRSGSGDCAERDDGKPARLYLCGRCRVQVTICSHCDRGQIYCADGCAWEARQGSVRAAGRRYQASRRGRLNHAVRAGQYRRRKNNVTHQGSPGQRRDGLLAADLVAVKPLLPDRSSWPRGHCHCCGRRCGDFVRRDFLRFRSSWRD